MPLSSGTRLGPYEIQTAIGAGGMGEVYKARDTRLDRSVAIKVLPAQVSADPERRTRFEREAKTIAGLNHPHICSLYDVGREEDTDFLVMEHLTGETLAQRLEKGPLPLEQALTVATEIADALSAAHRQGVIHRDLKPGNVMLTKAGAKLLDFGLAKLKGHGERPAAAHLESAPTQSTPLTGEGMIVGTLQYMAPEQVEGKPADARTDLWALGAILYEMVTGERAFEGTSAASLIGAILERDPAPLLTLQPMTPPGVDRLVRRCLAKVADDRPDTAHDVADDLRRMREMSGAGTATGLRRAHRRTLVAALLAAGGLVTAGAGAGLMWLLRPVAPRPPLARLALDIGPADSVIIEEGTPGGFRTALAWAPDGQTLVFVGRRGSVQQLYIRRLNAAEAEPLKGTEGAVEPAVSPDGRWIAFFANGAVRNVPLRGGLVEDVVSGIALAPFGLAWDDRGRLVVGSGPRGIAVLTPEGRPTFVTKVREERHILPWPLPGGHTLLYTVRKRKWSWGEEEIVAQRLDDAARTVLVHNGVDARYISTGHLVFLRQGRLFAVPFDPERLKILGREVPVLDGIAQGLASRSWPPSDVTGAGQFAVSPTGTLAYVSSPVVPYPDTALVTVDRSGRVTPLRAPVHSYAPRLRISPDGRRLAVTIRNLTEAGLWLYDFDRGNLTPLNRFEESDYPVWSPDGQRLAFSWLAGGRDSLATQPADGAAPPAAVANAQFSPSSFTPDGQHIAGVQIISHLFHIAMTTIEDGKAAVRPLNETPNSEMWPELSRDGRWLAYGSDMSGRNEVYVQPYPGPGPRTQVSIDGGSNPAWNPNERELFFLTPPDANRRRLMMVAEFSPGPPPHVGHPRAVFDFDDRELFFSCIPVRCYDVAPDGQRFFVVQPLPAPPVSPVTHINLIQNWFEELKAKVPTGR